MLEILGNNKLCYEDNAELNDNAHLIKDNAHLIACLFHKASTYIS